MRKTYEIIITRDYNNEKQDTMWEVINDIFDGLNGLDMRTERKIWLSATKGQYRYVFVANKKEMSQIDIIFTSLKKVYGLDYVCIAEVKPRLFPHIKETLRTRFARA